MSEGRNERDGNTVNEPSALQTARNALAEIRKNTRRALDIAYSDSEGDTPTNANVTFEREFQFNIHDYSLLADERNNVTTSSRDGSIFDHTHYYQALLNEMTNSPINATMQIASETIDQEIQRLSEQNNAQRHGTPQRENAILHELIREVNELRMEVSRLRQNEPANPPERVRASDAMPAHPQDLSYRRSYQDVRNQPGTSYGFLSLKEARNMIPEIDGTSRNRVRQFLNASSYAMKNVHPSDETNFLDAILCTKLFGKAMIDFQTREIRNFEQLKRELEIEYLGKRSTAHLQLEFNSLKQKTGESAQSYGHRVENLSMELYESMEDGKNHTPEQQRAILENIKEQALHNYQIGLREDIKLIVRAQRYETLKEAINAAGAEEKVTGSSSRSTNGDRYKNNQGPHKNTALQCQKCGKLGHHGKECRTSRYANKFSLPKPDKQASVNAVEKFCTYCKKNGHKKDECWSLHGRPDAERKHRTQGKQETKPKIKQVNTAIKEKKNKKYSESEESSSDSNEEEEQPKTRKTRPAREHQVTQVTGKREDTGLKLVVLPIQEVNKGKVNFLLDTGATLTLIKVGVLKGDTMVKEDPMVLTGVTGHKSISGKNFLFARR